MSTHDDRLVLFHPSRGWEVKDPAAESSVLCSTDRAEALQWAWNIVRATGGKVILQHNDGRRA